MEILWPFSYAEFNLNSEYSPPLKAAKVSDNAANLHRLKI